MPARNQSKSLDVRTMCLGILSFGEATGYELKRHFENGFHHFYAASFGSIYPALEALSADGLVACQETAEGGKLRKVYRLTPAGESALRATLAACEPTHRMRSEFLAVLCFAHLMSPEKLSALIDGRLAELDDTLARHHDLRDDAHAQLPASVRFVNEFGRHTMQAARDFIEQNKGWLISAAEREQPPDDNASRAPRARRGAA